MPTSWRGNLRQATPRSRFTSLARGCYELQPASGSMRVWRIENHTQATFPTKSGPLLPRSWHSFEETLHSATTICAKCSMD
jgi:hypothetical protein